MPWTEQARLLLRKARQDAALASLAVDDPAIADEIVGFHVQQAAEKCMKAVLCIRDVVYRRTHDLQELHDLLTDAGVSIPAPVAELVGWSPFAVAYRYEDWAEPGPVDRARGAQLVQAALMWAADAIGPEVPPPASG